MKKLSLDNQARMQVLWQTIQDFTYISFKAFICGIFVHLATHHIASKSFEIFQASPNNWLLIRKLSLIYSWCTGERFPGFTYGSHILSLSFMCLIFESLDILTKLPETLHKWLNELFVDEKNLVWITKPTSKCFGRLFNTAPIYLSRPFSVVYLFIWQLTLLHRSHFKFFRRHRITGFWLEN